MGILPTRWTSVAAPGRFVRLATERAYFRFEDLI